MKKSSSLLISNLIMLTLITSCTGIGQVVIKDNTVNAKADAKVNTDVKTGDINTDQSNNKQISTPNQATGSQPVKVTSVSVSPLSLSLNEEDQVNVVGTVNFSNDTTDTNIVWISSNNSVVSVNSNGEVRAIAQGTAIITATAKQDASKTAIISVVVNKKGTKEEDKVHPQVIVSSVSISPSFAVIGLGENINLNGTVLKSDGSKESNISWQTSDPNIAIVNSSGMVTGQGQGSVVIKAISNEDNSKVATVNITVQSQQNSPTPVPATPTPVPVSTSGATFNGKVYDPNGIVVDGATVTAKSVDPNVSWVGESQVTTNGAYVFRNAPVGARVEITVTKDGWTTRVRTEVLKSNLQGDPTANVFDFGGLGSNGNDQTSSFYAIQDEPEIVSLKINDRQATNSGGFSVPLGAGAVGNNGRFGIAFSQPGTGATATDQELKDGSRTVGGLSVPLNVSLTGVDNNRLDIGLVFSEPVDRESVQNNFKVVSQKFDQITENTKKSFEIDENLGSITFTWAADDKSVLVKTNKPILTTNATPEARYMLKWTNPFKDKTEKTALRVNQGNVSPTGFFRFDTGTNNDFNLFSTKIDDQDPRLLSIAALDGGSANDVIRLTFDEPLEVVNHSSLAFGLADPDDATNTSSNQLWGYNTVNGGCGNEAEVHCAGNNDVTVVGYNRAADGHFEAVYEIGRLPQNIATAANVETSSLGQGQDLSNVDPIASSPFRGAVTTSTVGNTSLLRFAKIDGNVVTMEFAPEAFNRNEKIIVSVGRDIATTYNDTSTAPSINKSFTVGHTATTGTIDFPLDKLTDPAGNTISTSNSTTSGNLRVNDSLRVATAS